jgi:hypothetical protein
MKCHLCDEEAVDRCYQCGQLFCDKHGKVNCASCDNGIAEGDPRRDRVSARPMPQKGRGLAWWRPISADDYVPPACYQCGGLTRARCVGCGRQFCAKHAGRGGNCADCQTASTTGTLIGLGAIGLIALAFVGALFLSWLRG